MSPHPKSLFATETSKQAGLICTISIPRACENESIHTRNRGTSNWVGPAVIIKMILARRPVFREWVEYRPNLILQLNVLPPPQSIKSHS